MMTKIARLLANNLGLFVALAAVGFIHLVFYLVWFIAWALSHVRIEIV